MNKDFHTSRGPYIKSGNTTTKMMRNLLFALLPIILFSVYKNGVIPFINNKTDIFGMIYPLIFILIPTITCFTIEFIYYKYIKKCPNIKDKMKDTFSIFPGLFLGLILPINTPLMILIMGSIFATIIGKLVFGGFGNNIFNPALLGRLFVIATYALVIGSSGGYLNSYEIDTISTSTPLTNASVVGVGTYNDLVAPYGSLVDFFTGTIPGAVGETSAVLCLLAFIFLTVTKVIKWRIPVIYIGTVFVMTSIIGSINGLGVWYPLFQVLSGGLMFGAIFMATDPVTSPTTPIGQVLYGLFLGILTVIFRYLTPLPEGVLTSILTMNMLVFVIDKIGSRARFDFNKCLILFVVAWLLILGISTTVGNKASKKPSDSNFSIISKDVKDKVTTYVVKQKGFSSSIKAKIIVDNGVITKIDVLEQNESYYAKIKDTDYIKKLIKDQLKIEYVDTISGATVTSSALKKMVINVKNDYGNVVISKITKEELADGFRFIVIEDSFGGDIKVQIDVINNSVKEVKVLEVNDSYYNLILEKNYLNQFKNIKSTNNIDAISGATVTSNAIKSAVNKALEELK